MSIHFTRPRYADVVATIALVIAMGGTAYAVTSLPANSVGTTQLKNGAVTRPKLADLGVGPGKLDDAAVTTTKLADGSVTTAKLGVGSVLANDIGPGSVTNSKLGAGSVTSSKLARGSVTGSKLAAGSVTGSRLANDTVGLKNIVGTDASGTIGFTLPAHSCGTITLGVPGAVVGQVAVLTYTGAAAVPASVVFSPMHVVSAGHIDVKGCNLGGTSVSVPSQHVRVVTFG